MPSINNSLKDFSEHIQKHITQSKEALNSITSDLEEPIYMAVNQVLKSFESGNKVLIAGNGGSAADAHHFAAELIVRLSTDYSRPALAALALTTDASILTAASNDFGFEQVFRRQLEGLGKERDTFIAISTSGNSKNLIEALIYAKEKKIVTIGLLGNDGGAIQRLVDIPITVRSNKTMHIQEAHICIYHLICDLIERSMF